MVASASCLRSPTFRGNDTYQVNHERPNGALQLHMALSEFETKRLQKALDAFIEKLRLPAHVRPQLDFGYRISGQSVELFEIRPVWNNPKEKRERPFAKATYVKTTETWRIFWQRADLKWHSYDPAPHVGSVEKFLEIVAEDKHACFFG
jgi:Protein of unknown function (DUF3024)